MNNSGKNNGPNPENNELSFQEKIKMFNLGNNKISDNKGNEQNNFRNPSRSIHIGSK